MLAVSTCTLLSLVAPQVSAKNLIDLSYLTMQQGNKQHPETETEHGHSQTHEHEDLEPHNSHRHKQQTSHRNERHTKQHTSHANEHNEPSKVYLTAASRKLAGIEVAQLTPQISANVILAPAEVKANGYTSFWVSPRVDSVVIKRHVALGEHVTTGQPLVTLFSESMAQAQADYQIFATEWRRVKNLKNSTLSESTLSEARTRYIAAKSTLAALGLSKAAIKSLTDNDTLPLGEYTLFASQSGSVLNDDFHQGQRINAGQTLLTLVDESLLWVEAKLPPIANYNLPAGTQAQLIIGQKRYSAEVIQHTHTIDSQTRTRVIRLAVTNSDHSLHPGQFGNVEFTVTTPQPVIAVPEAALIRNPDGDWSVFIEHDDAGEYEAITVTLGPALRPLNSASSITSLREITGVPAGAKVVIQGAFFIASEQAKSGFDPHNH